MTIEEYQDELYQIIVHTLRDYNVIRIYGPIGVGKTTLIKNRLMHKHFSFYSFSELDSKDANLFPMIATSSAFADKIKNTNTLTETLLEIDTSSKLSNPLKILFNIFSKPNSVARKLNNYFSDQEINIIIALMRLIEKSDQYNYYIILDDCEHINDRTLSFIRQLFLNADINKALENRLKIIFIENTPCEESALTKVTTASIKVEIDESIYYSYLRDTNHMQNYSMEDMKVLSAITSRDLTLTNVLLDYFKNNSIHKDILIQSSTPECLTGIFDEMISKHLSKHTQEISCLEVATVLGTIIDAYDLTQLTELERELVVDALVFGEEVGLIKRTKPDYSISTFLHPIIKDILYKKLKNKANLHRQYSGLLKKRYPTKHLLVAENLYRGYTNKQDVLHEYYVHLTMLAIRGEVSQFDNEIYITRYAINNVFSVFTNCFYEILLKYEARQLNDALEDITRISTVDIPDAFCKALLDYFQARIYIIFGDSDKQFVKAAELLRAASDTFYSAQMIDLYFDSLTVLLNVYAYKLSDLKTARAIEEKYIQSFQEVAPYIEGSELEYNFIEFKRRTASLLDAQGAYERMKDLFYKHNLEDYLQKYKAYSDMIGYSLYAGEFNTAYEYAKAAQEYITTNQFYSFPELFKVENNMLLAKLYNKDDEQIVPIVNEGIEILLKYEDLTDVSNVIKLNIACLYMLIGDYDKAETRLKYLFTKLSDYANAFYATYVPSNLAALYLLKADFSKALEFNKIARDHMSKWDQNYRMYYIQQNKYVNSLIESRTQVSPYTLFAPDTSSIVSEKTYKFVGRGILMSELLFYTL